MSECIYVDKCTYINNTIKHEGIVKDIFKCNYCRYYYKKCAIWKRANNIGIENIPLNLLPFQNEIVEDNRI